jgi:hypothetical protein
VNSSDGRTASEVEAAVSEYHSSRARYIRTVTSDVEKRLMESIGKRRAPLMEEITNLTTLAHARFDAYQTALKAYGAKAPSRVTAAGLQAPGPTERMIGGIDKLYKAALKAADEYNEVNAIIKKRRDSLDEVDKKMREQVEKYGHDLIAQLETPAGLEAAFKRDPLLGRAHARMLQAQAHVASIREGMK